MVLLYIIDSQDIPYLQNDFDQLLFSYHGIPEKHIYKTDATGGKHFLESKDDCCENVEARKTCYRYQVMATTKLVTEKLGLKKGQWQLSYQSRLGRDPWLQPNTQVRLPQLPEGQPLPAYADRKLSPDRSSFATDRVDGRDACVLHPSLHLRSSP